MNQSNIITDVCARFNIKLTDIRDNEEQIIAQSTGSRDDWIDNSYIYGNDEIVMGFYNDEDKRLASIFHEIGHILINKTDFPANVKTMLWEIECWNLGLEYARKEYGLVFSEDVVKWAYEKGLSYYKYA